MQLNAKNQKQQPVERELPHSPYFPRMRPRWRVDEARIVRSGVECRADYGQDAADLRRLGGQISGKRREQRKHGENKRIVHAKSGEANAHSSDQPCHGKTERESTAGLDEEL